MKKSTIGPRITSQFFTVFDQTTQTNVNLGEHLFIGAREVSVWSPVTDRNHSCDRTKTTWFIMRR